MTNREEYKRKELIKMLKGQKVWVVSYDGEDFEDLNEVFAVRADAEQSIKDNFLRMSAKTECNFCRWVDCKMTVDSENYFEYKVDYIYENELYFVYIHGELHTIQ
jgi:hypothetical protein